MEKTIKNFLKAVLWIRINLVQFIHLHIRDLGKINFSFHMTFFFIKWHDQGHNTQIEFL